ncbi:MAG TPA: heparinase II/III family protein [Candidatus Bathyarchaeia archaeon]|nr:heparinase II/III family protein [Candidatus Bathyarchaeia archaeon]
MRLLLSLLLLMPALCAFAEGGLKPVPINEAEAIIVPFFSPEMETLKHWTVDPGDAYGLGVKQNWGAVDFEWASRPASCPALRVSSDLDVDCAGYDKLIVCVAAPAGSVVRIMAATDAGDVTYSAPPAEGNQKELCADLDGATRIRRITLEIDAGSDGPAGGWLRWIGLQSTERLPLYFGRWDFSGLRWDAHLRDDTYKPSFKPRYGIFLTPEELAGMRDEHARAVAATGTSPYADRVKAAGDYVPERGIHEFVNSGGSTGAEYRDRDADQPRIQGGPDLAVAALVVGDAAALRMAARYALSLASAEHWDRGMLAHVPGCPWEDRAFKRSYTCDDVARILDLGGELFNDTGRKYLMRRLAEEGVGGINFTTWRHEYIFSCNQLAFFNSGRMAAYLVMEREWPRVKPYTDIALEDTMDSLAKTIEPDGGSLEGPGYFCPTVRENYNVIKHYARARGLDVASLTPPVLKRTPDFAAAVASTTADDVIAICDSEPHLSLSALEMFNTLAPGTYWATLYNKKCRAEGKEPLGNEGPPLPHFVSLPDTGHMASVRDLDGEPVKIFIMGNKRGAGHTHEDKGSFVLEFAGETFAADLGICEYDDPIHYAYKSCQRHNMLVPAGMTERARPDNPIMADVKPKGRGNAKKFNATIDATPGWKPYYRKWVRTWESPAPDRLTIRDQYEIAKGDAVEFYWQTQLPCEHSGQTVTIHGARGTATLTAPPDCPIRLETLPLANGRQQQRITIKKPGTAGELAIDVKLTKNPV